ncbi:MAG TPA: hypothetical protein VK607_10530 [Kofleriaceae bacterium]|nr:hypothetical protein [Kofleriaceae bacterium]
MIAALFVEPMGVYAGDLFSPLADVELWTEARDARLYPGPHPVVAHPPCARWCAMAGLVEYLHGRKRGDDGGCFEFALAAVRRWGGVLEHPAFSHAWDAFDLPVPDPAGWWTPTDAHGGAACQVEQGHYGHRARKRTWLYAVRTTRPELLWGPAQAARWVTYTAKDSGIPNPKPGIHKRERSATPPAFRDVLLQLARSVATG